MYIYKHIYIYIYITRSTRLFLLGSPLQCGFLSVFSFFNYCFDYWTIFSVIFHDPVPRSVWYIWDIAFRLACLTFFLSLSVCLIHPTKYLHVQCPKDQHSGAYCYHGGRTSFALSVYPPLQGKSAPGLKRNRRCNSDFTCFVFLNFLTS